MIFSVKGPLRGGPVSYCAKSLSSYGQLPNLFFRVYFLGVGGEGIAKFGGYKIWRLGAGLGWDDG